MKIDTYLKNKTNEKVLEIVGSQMDLDDNIERHWFNPSTGTVLSNYAYMKMIINEAIDGCSKATLKNNIKIANKIVDYFKSEEDFKYIDFNFDDNLDSTYTVRIVTNFGGFCEYVLGLIDWDETQGFMYCGLVQATAIATAVYKIATMRALTTATACKKPKTI